MASYMKNQHLDLEVLLMGVTGHGKSATGNSILGREQFVSEGGWGSVTKDYHVGHTHFNGRTIKIVDIPGFGDTDEKTSEEKQQLVIGSISRALIKFPNGFHAVLLVISYAHRLTKEVQESLNLTFRQFDEEAFRAFGVLVVTNGDVFERDHRKTKMSLQTWLENNCPRFLNMCGNRCVLFDNVVEDPNTKRSQIEKLLSQIDGMVNENKRYIPRICRFKEGNNKGDFEIGRQRAAQNEEISDLLGLLNDKICKSKSGSEIEIKREIVLIRDKIDSLEHSLDKQRFHELLTKLEDDLKRQGKRPLEKVSCSETITTMQKELDKDSQNSSWWDTIVNGVTKFCELVNNPLVIEVGMTILNGFGGKSK